MAAFGRRVHGIALVAGLGLAVVVAGCGSSGTTPSTPASVSMSASAVTPAPAGQVTVTFTGTGLTSDVVDRELALVKQRITSEQLSGATAGLSPDGHSLVVRGPSAEKDQLVMLGHSGVLEFRPVLATGVTGASSAASSSGQTPSGVPADLWQSFVGLDCKKAEATDEPAVGHMGEQATAQIVACQNDGAQKYVLDATAVSGASISSASTQPSSTAGGWEVDLSLNAAGATQFGQLTTRLAGSGGQVAITMDGIVYSAPAIQNPITGGQVQIVGSFNQATARSLAAILESGALPVSLSVSSVS